MLFHITATLFCAYVTGLLNLPSMHEPCGFNRIVTAGRVVNRLGHCGDDIARKIRFYTRYQRNGDHLSSHNLARQSGLLKPPKITVFHNAIFWKVYF